MSLRFTIASQTVLGKVDRMGGFYSLASLVTFYSFLLIYVCTWMHKHAQTDTREKAQGWQGGGCAAPSLIHMIQKPAAAWCRAFFLALNIYEKKRNQRWIDWYRSSKSDSKFLIWIAFLKNPTSASGFYSSINIHLFEKWSTCWEPGKTPGTECKYPEPWDLYQQSGRKIYFLPNRHNTDKVIHAGCQDHDSEPSGAAALANWGQEGMCLCCGHVMSQDQSAAAWMTGLSLPPWAEVAAGGQTPVLVVFNWNAEISFNTCEISLTEPLAAKSPEHEFWQGKSPLLSVMFQPLFYEYIQWQELACFQDNKIQTLSMIALKETSCHFIPLKKLTIWWAKCQK